MLCTVILDSYAHDERTDIVAALERLLAPGSPDWSRRGVYSYWDRDSHEILYLGLATDLPTRFAQHNGLVSHGGGNKTNEIDRYFDQNRFLGFTVVIQGAAVALHDRLVELDFTLGAASTELIGVGEGQLIETHRLVHGRRPRWNKTGGSRQGKRMATAAAGLLDMLAGQRSSLFVARRSLRDLAASGDACTYEAVIHAARMRATMDAHEFGRSSDDTDELIAAISRATMLNAGHLLDELEASDTTIVDWLQKLGDPEHWREEAMEHRRMLTAIRGHKLQGNELEVANILDAIVAGAAPPEHLAATAAIFESGYLNEAPHLPA